MSLSEELTALERQGWSSLCDGTGDRYFGELMTEDGLMVLAHGMVLDRAQVVASLADAPPWEGFELRDERVLRVGSGAALVYEATAWRETEAPFVALMASVYTPTSERWRLALYQQTPVPDGG